jgi:hypothetical protein
MGEPYMSSFTRNLFMVSQVPVPYMRREPRALKSAPRKIGASTLAPPGEPTKWPRVSRPCFAICRRIRAAISEIACSQEIGAKPAPTRFNGRVTRSGLCWVEA